MLIIAFLEIHYLEDFNFSDFETTSTVVEALISVDETDIDDTDTNSGREM